MPTVTTKRRSKAAPIPLTTPRPDPLALARRLATLADVHMQMGFHRAAEVLAFRAEAAREGGQ